MYKLVYKLKAVSITLCKWNKSKVGSLLDTTRNKEALALLLKVDLDKDPLNHVKQSLFYEARHEAIRAIKYEESLFK